MGPPNDAEFDIMPTIRDKAPKLSNVYTDGSTKYPTH